MLKEYSIEFLNLFERKPKRNLKKARKTVYE